MKKYLKICSLLILILLLWGCGGGHEQSKFQNEIADYADDKILISGLTEEDFELTAAELMEMETVTRSATASMANGKQVKVKIIGPLLETLLQRYNKSQKDFALIRFSAMDNYSIAVPSDILKNREIILGLMDKGAALPEDDRPVRVVIPEERAMYWVRKLNRIDFETGESAELCRKMVFLDTAAQNLPQEDYEYYESLDKVIKTRDLVGKYADINDDSIKNVFLYAGDGLYKNERAKNFLNGYLKTTGQDIPRFLSPDLPQGMHVRDLLNISYGDTSFFSLDQALKVFRADENVPSGSIIYTDIIKHIGTIKAKNCRLVAADSTTLEFDISRMANSYFYLEDDGTVTFVSGSPENKTLRALLSMEFIE
ncbi:MAG TPA: molybdopterin-dependent oxidoreductase [Anaerovoracaceae bacterium]|nr:molybdopterin-dependent oxidoreductase [Anaerovoracaceae bacterium]